MKKFVIQFILLITIIGIAMFFLRPGADPVSLPFFPQATIVKNLQINGQTIKVEIADTQEKRSKGLGGRQSLASGSGMLFIFNKPDKYAFWMKDVNFSLDFVFIRQNMVVDVIQNVPHPAKGTEDSALPIYQPKVEIDKVLEVSAGTVRDFNILVGDSIKII